MAKNLNLSIYKQYFDEIKAGTKKIEYREIKDYYTKKFIIGGVAPGEGELKAVHYDTVTFYTKEGDKMVVEWKGVNLYPRKDPKWYAIQLGEILYPKPDGGEKK